MTEAQSRIVANAQGIIAANKLRRLQMLSDERDALHEGIKVVLELLPANVADELKKLADNAK
jgi:hypothetical protein